MTDLRQAARRTDAGITPAASLTAASPHCYLLQRLVTSDRLRSLLMESSTARATCADCVVTQPVKQTEERLDAVILFMYDHCNVMT